MVITIVGIISSVVVLSFGALNQRKMTAERDHLILSFRQAADQSTMRQQTLGWFFDDIDQQYWFAQLSKQKSDSQRNEQRSKQHWQSLKQDIFSRRTLSPYQLTVVDAGGKSYPKGHSNQPLLVFLPSGEYTAFHIKLAQGDERELGISGDGFNDAKPLSGEQW